jgi:protein O-mannosyl-transferase
MKKPAPPTKAPSDLWIYALLTAGIFAAYAPVLRFGFVNYDDPVYIANNPHVRAALPGAAWSGRSRIPSPATGSRSRGSPTCSIASSSGWMPGCITSPTWRSTPRRPAAVRGAAAHHPGSLAERLVAGLFALHPLHVESVAWIAERKDVLSAFFWMLTLWAYARYVARPTPSRYAWTLAASPWD